MLPPLHPCVTSDVRAFILFYGAENNQSGMQSSSNTLNICIKVIPGIHYLQGREHMGQGLLFGQITI